MQDLSGRHPPVLLELGTVSEEHLAAEVGAKQGTDDLEPRSHIERLILSVEPPGKSMRSAGRDEEGTLPRRVEVRDCQWWVKEVVRKLVKEGVLGREALRRLEGVPAR